MNIIIRNFSKPTLFMKSCFILTIYIVSTILVFSPNTRILSYSAALVLLTYAQHLIPDFNNRQNNTAKRLITNYSFNFINLIISGVPAFAAANYVSDHELGLLINSNVSFIGIAVISVFALDFGFFVLHLMFHKSKFLYRFHAVHHNDKVYETSMFGRDHPFSALCTGLIRAVIILTLGIPLEALFVFLLCVSMLLPFSHSNIRLPIWLDKFLGVLVVTPRYHYVHHSIDITEGNSNFSVLFSVWDRLFGTYNCPYKLDLDKITIGMKDGKTPDDLTFIKLIKMPFIN